MRTVWGARQQVPVALDFGSGDGWFTQQLMHAGIAEKVVAVDVKLWPSLITPPVLFDGRSLPFADRAFELVFAVDVLHHCPEPEQAIEEVLRCCKRYFLLKDHSYRTVLEWTILSLLDEVGNRRFRVPSPHRYQRDWSWDAVIHRLGFKREALLNPASCHVGPLGYCTNRLQFVALWRRIEETTG
jgi:SAM-dependent methyltransferase